ncbi:MAG: hypothetical protein LBU27_00365 [Candidatus Peribacteria bacterium]|jgi:replicative DNA helicase|nr:hypothetical protein [Candidatus Peribacteria bacterium]
MNYEEIEKLLLSMLMNETSLILECRLSAECFEKAEHRKIFDEMKKQKEIDIFKLTQKFKEFTDYIFEIIGYVVSTSKYAEYEDELIERYERKRIMGVAKNVGLMCKDGEDITKILEEAHKIQNVEEKEADIKYILADIVEELTGGKEIAKYPTGYPKLDEMLGGFTI